MLGVMFYCHYALLWRQRAHALYAWRAMLRVSAVRVRRIMRMHMRCLPRERHTPRERRRARELPLRLWREHRGYTRCCYMLCLLRRRRHYAAVDMAAPAHSFCHAFPAICAAAHIFATLRQITLYVTPRAAMRCFFARALC